ncbi:MAG: hypothetical protein GY839_09135 [candidate division Zixibacteria bacterium]|nr:hypothetical protein [candidate division Zixibacteria bacterium]
MAYTINTVRAGFDMFRKVFSYLIIKSGIKISNDQYETDSLATYSRLSNIILRHYNSRIILNCISGFIVIAIPSLLIYLIINPEFENVLVKVQSFIKGQIFAGITFLQIALVVLSVLFSSWIIMRWRRSILFYFLRSELKEISTKMKNLHPVSIKFMLWLIKDTLSAKNTHINSLQNNNTMRIIEVGKQLEDSGLILPAHIFAKLLCYSATMHPDRFRGVWNTFLYPPEDVFTKDLKQNKYEPVSEWKEYFRELGKLLDNKTSKIKERHRIFIVEDGIDLLILAGKKFFDDSPQWKHVLELQKEWNIKEQLIFPTDRFKDVLGNKGGEFQEFVIFGDQPEDAWLVGQVRETERVSLITNSNPKELNTYFKIYNLIIKDDHRISLTLKANEDGSSCIHVSGNGFHKDKHYDVPL